MNDTETEFVLFKGKSTALDTELKLNKKKILDKKIFTPKFVKYIGIYNDEHLN